MNVAILGYGVVGSGVETIISEQLGDKEPIKVVKIWNRPNKTKQIPYFVSDIEEIINDPSIECVVEALNGIHPAYEHIMACLKKGKHVVSANKAVVAAFFEEFQQVAHDNQVYFKYEASVGGGIPWIKELKRAKRTDAISSISGILNGTSNYILSTMAKAHLSFSDVLLDAQELGYAEADPSADIDGFDILNKLIISSYVAFEARVKPDDFLRLSMRGVTLEDSQYFHNLGYELKYLGTANVENESLEGDVMLTACSKQSLEANTSLNYNCVSLVGETIGTLSFYGQGAGQLPTAHSMVQDLLDITNESHQIKLNSVKDISNKGLKTYQFVVRSQQSIPESFVKREDQGYCYLLPMSQLRFKEVVMPLLEETDLVVKMEELRGECGD
ncbi:homoserine dehydrogenase [Vagococcus sp. DIV0080]|uniref:Homoserine dehydrogenase n=1 Tax=Candidatus Vagococcus giribetii TaxID=2230876 RepID=A0ABS3HRB4_9ENTE|nr:homoserine dehydrogenase [Vagococcus sp. DIV0080]MBO0476280.1 homoserine dehydrogenase [Vagococcus sp. DIV0080]